MEFKFVLAAGVAACLLAPTQARASAIVSIESVNVTAGSSGNGIDVELTNSGPAAITIGGFSFEISIADLDISFTGANTSTAAAYIFGTDSLFGPILAGPSSGQSLATSDVFSIFFSGATLDPGATVGLGHVLFDVSPTAASGSFSVDLALFPSTSLSDESGNDVPIDAFVSGQITIAGPEGDAVPEPSSLLLLASGVAVLAGRARRRRALALAVTTCLTLGSVAGAQTAPPAGARGGAPKAAPKSEATGTAVSDVDAVIQLVKSGMPESLVVKTIQKSGKAYTLAPPDVLRLRNAGVGNAVIEAMMDASPAPAGSSPAPKIQNAEPAKTVSPSDREPTEEEMLAVLKSGFAAANESIKETEDACRSGAYKKNNDPGLALQCLAGAMATGGRGGLRTDLTGFRKVACNRASGEAGWNCDWVMRMDVSGINAPPSLKGMMNAPAMQHGRFVYTGGQWIRVN